MSNNPEYGQDRRHDAGPQSEQFVVVKSWHTVIIVVTLMVTLVLSYGSLRDRLDEHTRAIEELKSRPQVSKPELEAIDHRLERIERKLDAQDLRDFQRDFNPTKKK